MFSTSSLENVIETEYMNQLLQLDIGKGKDDKMCNDYENNCYEMILRVTKIDILIWKSENYQLKEAE
jgi:hypothetical protein